MVELPKDSGTLLFQGAEALVYLHELEDKLVVEKVRIPKRYRHPKLDASLKKSRYEREIRNLRRAKDSGVNVPGIVSYNNKDATYHQDFIDGITAKDLIDGLSYIDRGEADVHTLCQTIGATIGEQIAKLHDANVVHGDITTSNILVSTSNSYRHADDKNIWTKHLIHMILTGDMTSYKLHLIDFGLSESSIKAEDRAIDLYVLERGINSSHSCVSKHLINSIVKQYSVTGQNKNNTLKRLIGVRKRGRKRQLEGF